MTATSYIFDLMCEMPFIDFELDEDDMAPECGAMNLAYLLLGAKTNSARLIDFCRLGALTYPAHSITAGKQPCE